MRLGLAVENSLELGRWDLELYFSPSNFTTT